MATSSCAFRNSKSLHNVLHGRTCLRHISASESARNTALNQRCGIRLTRLRLNRHLGIRRIATAFGSSRRSIVNEAGFEVGITMSPEEAVRLGIKPFGDGGAEGSTTPKPKVYTHGPCATDLAAQFVVACHRWEQEDVKAREQTAGQALQVLKTNGFVVLDGLFDGRRFEELEQNAAEFLGTHQAGLVPQPLRAGRTEGHLPCSLPWKNDWLKHPLILDVVAKYLKNCLAAGRTQEEQQWALVQWLTSGADLDWFQSPEWGPKPGNLLDAPPAGCSDVGSPRDCGPFFGRISLIKVPAGSEPQKYHRDINFPGPAAQLTVQVSLTPLLANNGPLAFTPGSHRMATPGYDVIASPPVGSVVLYDSFVEHRGIENHTQKDRYAMYYEFEMRGVFSGYTDAHFGPESAKHTRAFRRFVDPELQHWVRKARAQRTDAPLMR